jgi:hypothetical protein
LKTMVTIHFNNGITTECSFDLDIKTFNEKWDNHIAGIGYFTHTDDEGSRVIINPSQCGFIHIEEI